MTEYESMKIEATDGAATEICGSFIFPIGKTPPDRPIFINPESRMSVVYDMSVYRSNRKVHLRDTQKGVTQEVGNDALFWHGSRARMDLSVSERE